MTSELKLLAIERKNTLAKQKTFRPNKSIQKLRKSFTGKGLNKSQPSFKKAIKASKSFNKSQRQLDKKLGDLKQSRNAEVEPSIVQTKEFSSISSFQSM